MFEPNVLGLLLLGGKNTKATKKNNDVNVDKFVLGSPIGGCQSRFVILSFSLLN